MRGVAPVHASSIFNCFDLSPPHSVMGWWTRADSIGASPQEWWQTPIFSVHCAAQHRMKCRPCPHSRANQLMSVRRYIARNCGTGLRAQRQRRLESSALRRLEFSDEEGLMCMINAFNVIFQQRGAVHRKAWRLHRTVLYHSDELLLRGMNPFGESRGESRFNQDLILFRTNKCSTYPQITTSSPPYFTYICQLNSGQLSPMSSMRTSDSTLKVWKVFQVHIGSAGLLKWS